MFSTFSNNKFRKPITTLQKILVVEHNFENIYKVIKKYLTFNYFFYKSIKETTETNDEFEKYH